MSFHRNLWKGGLLCLLVAAVIGIWAVSPAQPVPEGGDAAVPFGLPAPPPESPGVPLPGPLLSGAGSWAEAAGAGEPVPSIQAVQSAAVRYAEADPGKIAGWRRRARWRAFLPRFSVGLDRDRNANIVSSTRDGSTHFTVGPERRNLALDLSFTWELGELVWNPDQTSIDARSRLMVYLRRDILEEVNRTYFERLRLASEFSRNPTEDSQLRTERRLRLEELSARLDALTGGFFSRFRSEKDSRIGLTD